MRYLTRTLNDLLAASGLRLAPWMAPAAALLIFAVLSPWILRSRRLKLARKRLQQAEHAGTHAERLRLQQEALELVAGNPAGLVGVAEEALRRGMRPLAERAVAELAETGEQRLQLRLLLRKLEGDKPRTPEGEAAAIERLLAAGLGEAARERYEAASRRWPRSEAIRELRGRLH